MPDLEVEFRTDDGETVAYTVEGDLKRPGEAVASAREAAVEEHDRVSLAAVRLAE